MPQMSPYNWLILMFFFNMIYFYMMIYNYYYKSLYINKKMKIMNIYSYKMKW